MQVNIITCIIPKNNNGPRYFQLQQAKGAVTFGQKLVLDGQKTLICNSAVVFKQTGHITDIKREISHPLPTCTCICNHIQYLLKCYIKCKNCIYFFRGHFLGAAIIGGGALLSGGSVLTRPRLCGVPIRKTGTAH